MGVSTLVAVFMAGILALSLIGTCLRRFSRRYYSSFWRVWGEPPSLPLWISLGSLVAIGSSTLLLEALPQIVLEYPVRLSLGSAIIIVSLLLLGTGGYLLLWMKVFRDYN